MKYILLILFVLLSSSTYAYIDPGTSGIIIGGLWQTIVGFLGVVIGFLLINPIKKIIKKLKNGKKKHK